MLKTSLALRQLPIQMSARWLSTCIGGVRVRKKMSDRRRNLARKMSAEYDDSFLNLEQRWSSENLEDLKGLLNDLVKLNRKNKDHTRRLHGYIPDPAASGVSIKLHAHCIWPYRRAKQLLLHRPGLRHRIAHSSKLFTPSLKLVRFCHFGSPKIPQTKVGIFWDLDNKPPNASPPYEVAIKLRKTVSCFGIVRYMVAYANRHAFSYVPPSVKKLRNERKVLNHLENKGVIKSVEPYVCRVCGRKFNTNDKLMGHFTIHEREHQKRVNQIQSAKGKKRLNLVGRYAMKMEKYRNACKDVVTPKVGYGLANELKRAGFWVRTVSDKPQAADVALRNCMVDLMDRRAIQCLVLVSDDSDFVGVLKEARERCVKTVVVGGNDDGVLKRSADACFSWRDIIVGKARSEAGSVVGRWRDRDILKRLEWAYDPEVKKGADELSDSSDFEDAECGDSTGKDDSRLVGKDDKPWWELDSDAQGAHFNSSSSLQTHLVDER